MVNLCGHPKKWSTFAVNPNKGRMKINELKKKKLREDLQKTQKKWLFFCVFLPTFVPKIFEIKLIFKFCLILIMSILTKIQLTSINI
jgi:hypothetical protein